MEELTVGEEEKGALCQTLRSQEQQEHGKMKPNERQMRETEGKAGKEGMSIRSERCKEPFRSAERVRQRDSAQSVEVGTPRKAAKASGTRVVRDREQALGWGAGIACEQLVPREANMCPLRPGKDRRLWVWPVLAGRA